MENLSAKRELTGAIALIAIIMLVTANVWGVLETSEARYAEISREMIRSGDWLHPSLLNIHHYHKPPFTYWITAASYSIFGVNAFASRFFLTVAYCIQVLLVYKLAMRLFNIDVVGYFSAIVYATLPLVLISVRALTTDAYLNLFTLLSIYFFVSFRNSENTRFLYLAALSLGAGFITKGPVVLIIPFCAMIGLNKVLPRTKPMVTHALLAGLLFITISFGWFVYLVGEDALFLDYFVLHHFVDRITHAEVFSRKEPWYYYLPIIPLVTAPWILVFVKGIVNRKRESDDQRLAWLIFIWLFVIPLIIFSVSSSKLVLYILPLSIGFSLVTGYFLSIERSRKLLISTWMLICIIYVGLLVAPMLITGAKVSLLLWVMPSAVLLVTIYVGFATVAIERKVLIVSLLFAACLVIYSSFYFRLNSTQVNSIRSVSNFIKNNGLANGKILVYNELLPSLSFELDKDIICLNAGNRSLNREVQFEQNDSWTKYLINTNSLSGNEPIRQLLSGKTVVVVRDELPPTVNSLLEGEWHSEKIGKWTLIYN